MRLRDRVVEGSPSVLFEIVCPKKNVSREKFNSLVDLAARLCSSGQVEAINLPEIRGEERLGGKSGKLADKIEARRFAKAVNRRLGHRHQTVVCRSVPHLPPERQKRWLLRTYREFGVRNLVIVGGERHPDDYPGWSVTEAAEYVTNSLEHASAPYFCGGICIPHRRFPGTDWDEPSRLIQKGQAGLEFFITQIIFDAAPVCRLLLDYQRLCRQKGHRPKMIFLSFNPVSSPRDLAFLEKLGVKFSPISKKLLARDHRRAEASLEVTNQLLQDILSFKHRHHLSVPLGLNIGYVSGHNLSLSQKLIAPLKAKLISQS
jgi:5,10-methylenetetrahydrofolate reductase